MINLIISYAVRQLMANLRLLLRVLNAWETILWGMSVIAAALIVSLRYEIGQNGDGLLQTLISLQHLTFFFWGQDRFANVVPWLASAVSEPTTNAQLQLAIRIGLGVAAPLLFCVPYAESDDRFGAGRATLLATALALAFMPQRFVYEWFIEASPYGTSFAISGFALLLFSAANSSDRVAGLAFRIFGLILTFAAYAVNSSLVLVTAPMFALLVLLCNSSLAAEFIIASVISGLCVALAAATTNVAHTSMRFGETFIGVTYYLQQMRGKTGIFLIAMFGLFVVIVIISTLMIHKPKPYLNRKLIRYGIVLFITSIFVFLGVSLSSWVVMNFLHPKYLVPLFCIMAALGALSITHLFDCFSVEHPAVHGRITLALCVLVLVYAGARGLAPIPKENGIVADSVRPLATEISNIVTNSRLDAIAGDYWVVWPSVFLAEQQAFTLRRPSGQIFGVTYRGDARRQALEARLLTQGHLDIICVDLPNANCLCETATMIGIPLSITSSLTVKGRSDDDPLFHVLTLTPH